jgi:hypothetical protein
LSVALVCGLSGCSDNKPATAPTTAPTTTPDHAAPTTTPENKPADH